MDQQHEVGSGIVCTPTCLVVHVPLLLCLLRFGSHCHMRDVQVVCTDCCIAMMLLSVGQYPDMPTEGLCSMPECAV